ncbi:RimJ/RimL family protein N-acetyltransferase [Deinobacterium chartae]|uniref:RimJ/RimL family protein N-acetyltransferase n=1 Tax=Deinobacterium chartae TaxID=521158 RepID=A0A841HVZ0_9DEIO|nr:GNAT family protein [Deinobacterium chartae]MBB6097691.1 RimJ/RimL family protein N-acetyltransferase [Deinobacterium chartae]
MNLDFVRVGPERLEQISAFLTAEPWPYHGRPRLSAEQVRASAAEGVYWSDETETFLVLEAGTPAAYLRLFDLDDPTALFDLRIRAARRGQGLGQTCVRWLSAHLFETRPELHRIAANTRVDNHAMRAVLGRCGYVLEAYYRQAWPQEGRLHDCVSYALLRSDWESGTLTPTPFSQEAVR